MGRIDETSPKLLLVVVALYFGQARCFRQSRVAAKECRLPLLVRQFRRCSFVVFTHRVYVSRTCASFQLSAHSPETSATGAYRINHDNRIPIRHSAHDSRTSGACLGLFFYTAAQSGNNCIITINRHNIYDPCDVQSDA